MALPIGSSDHEHGCACGACNDDTIEHARAEARSQAKADGRADVVQAHDHALLTHHLWEGSELTFSFPDQAEVYGQGATMSARYGTGEATDGFAPLNAAQNIAAKFALAQFAAVSGLSFECLEGTDAGAADIRFAQSAQPSTAWGYYPSDFEEGGDIWLGREEAYYDAPIKGGYAWHTILHETGHALGLRHGHDAGALSAARDSMEYSVMTYRAFINDPIIGGYSNAHGSYAQTLMQEDIAAAQDAYGANYDHEAGDTTYHWNPRTGLFSIDGEAETAPATNTILMTVWDGGGTDCFDFSSYRTNATIDLRAGAGSTGDTTQLAHLNASEAGATAPIFASASVFTALLHNNDTRGLIENALGGHGNDKMFGNQSANRLEGGRGHDKLGGMQGKDHLIGGQGRDVLNGGGGRDVLSGGAHDDRLFGAAGHDKLKGGSGDDTLTGGAGNDKLTGGRGHDTFVFTPDGSRDRIMDFTSGEDLIDLTAFASDFADLTITANQITLDNTVIRIANVGEAG
ncbi:MAG: M10 family metallopeptidase C-terminal domain-containing protein, partial [Pikeienuella sp.]